MTRRVVLQALSPMAISRSRATGNELDTLGQVPGTTWRGALANAVLEDIKPIPPEIHPEFRMLFLDGKLRFSDLRPRGASPFPLSGRVCADNGLHPVHDGLLTPLVGQKHLRRCGEGGCAAKVKAYSGMAYIDRVGRIEWERMGRLPRKRVVAHTSIDNESLRARPGQFHTGLVLERGTLLEGSISGAKDVVACAQTWIKKCRPMVVGRGGTRGQGLVEISVEQPLGDDDDLDARIKACNQTLLNSNMVAFTVTVQTPCLVFDDFLNARSYITHKDLREAGAGALDGYELFYWSSRLITVAGWNSQAGLPKPDELAIAPGSAFVFAKEATAEVREAEIDRLRDALRSFDGALGERCDEGFGEARLCDAFHYLHCRGEL